MKHGSETIASPLWVGFEGKTLPVALSRWLARGEVGGVVLYSRNIESPTQVRGLCRGIRSAAGRGNPVPLIAVDQEGGRVARFKDPPFSWFPPARACSLFCCRNEAMAEAVGAATAAELRAVGIDVNFAPVLDVDSNPGNPVIGDRAFSEDRTLRPPWESPSRRDRSPGGSSPSGNISRATGTPPPTPTRNCPSSGRDGRRSFAANCSPSAAPRARGFRRS
jgi:hypothetical protein